MKTKIDKLNLALMIISWIITVWGIIAENLSSTDSRLDPKIKFWISMTVPISTSILSFIESIQVGMDVREVQVARKLELQNLNNTVIHNLTINEPKSFDFGNGMGFGKSNNDNGIGNISNFVDSIITDLNTLNYNEKSGIIENPGIIDEINDIPNFSIKNNSSPE